MQHDEVIWSVINHGHCSYKAKLNNNAETFCRNEYNVTGLCNRTSCPLANSRYATVLEKEGVIYLYMKSIERAHTPKKLWERVRLSTDYAEALQQIDKHLEFWPKFMIHKNKQRLTKITQYLIRIRNLKKKGGKKLVTVPRRTEKRDLRRETKAEQAAKLDNSIEKELLMRLQSGTYGDIYNFPIKNYNNVLDSHMLELEEEELDDEEDEMATENEEVELENNVEYVEDYDIDEEDDMEDFDFMNLTDGGFNDDDDDDDDDNIGEGTKKRRHGSRKSIVGKKKRNIEIEYEDDTRQLNEALQQQQQ